MPKYETISSFDLIMDCGRTFSVVKSYSTGFYHSIIQLLLQQFYPYKDGHTDESFRAATEVLVPL